MPMSSVAASASTSSGTDSVVYVFALNEGSGKLEYKIGSTGRTPETRLREWRRGHQSKGFRLVYSVKVVGRNTAYVVGWTAYGSKRSQNYRLGDWLAKACEHCFVVRTLPQEPGARSQEELKMLWQRLPSFQLRIPDIDLDFSRERIRAPGFPSSLEHTQISQMVAEAEKDLSDYEEDLRCLDSIVSDLRKKRDDLQRYVDDCKAYLSPIRQLPTEIMEEIFLYYQDLHGTRKGGRFREPINHSTQDLTALLLSSVCKLWHSICLCTPQLWSRFSVVLNRSRVHGAPSQLLPIYLSRSKQMPLCFDIKIDGRYCREPTKILSLLVAQSHRWFSTNWDLYNMDEEGVACLGVQKELPLLQHIALKRDGASSGDLLGIFAGARTPRTVSLTRMSNFLDSKLPWSEVHFLRAYNISSDVGVVDILVKLAGQCCTLRSFEAHSAMFPSNTVSPYEIGEFFSIATLPNLRRLALVLYNDSNNDTHTPNTDSFRSFISRSQCSISVLRLGDLRLNEAFNPICDMLPHLPALKKLIFAEEYCDAIRPTLMETLMETLSVHSPHSIEAGQGADSLTAQNDDPVLPLLEELDMEVCAEDFQASKFVDMVESRCSLTGHGICALKSSLEGTGIEIISSTSDSRQFLRDEHQGWACTVTSHHGR
ncbi:hypothetical protein D9758_018721 [Tetrapyrgos nigripes]|uniref:F-box domain-containing protein n=1 Tax=Tetrapyrgos nigripes TaxID=182062 RepID=A0A8H5B5A6_9AGAR|nr:hypothetical protein D9758_018721 [Tetrapyrgos nigripes]